MKMFTNQFETLPEHGMIIFSSWIKEDRIEKIFQTMKGNRWISYWSGYLFVCNYKLEEYNVWSTQPELNADKYFQIRPQSVS